MRLQFFLRCVISDNMWPVLTRAPLRYCGEKLFACICTYVTDHVVGGVIRHELQRKINFFMRYVDAVGHNCFHLMRLAAIYLR
jgi:bacterioferritin-associated ferredoxin